ncbi:G-protein coupled receptor daf-37-like [Biomphalaria glabrata]|uniref:G-protein coupled receptor daf-37-like n=1 Tax=Biomphalaria glabrata TaxID=6526 RepID=A0A9W3AQU1_BIOGL|nr:G-protein coupled receptor daf-37-like [Biomphalaria glabrata]
MSNTTGHFSSEPEQWGELVRLIGNSLLTAIGLVANTFTFVVMKTPRLRYKSYSHYLSALAVFDSLVLVDQEIVAVDGFLLSSRLSGIFQHFSHDACKIFMFADAVCNLMSTWLIVAMAIERLCVVYMPFKRNMWCQQRGAIIIIISLFCVFSSTQIFRFFTTERIGDACESHEDFRPIHIALHIYMYQFALHFVGPVFLVLVSNIGVLIKIFKVERAIQNDESSSTRLTGSVHRRGKTTRMLVAISMTYIVTTLPLVIVTIFIHIMIERVSFQFAPTLIRLVPWIHVLQIIANLNYCSNFFIYIMSGKKFRKELRRIFYHENGSSFVIGSSRTRDEIIMMSY